MRQLNPNLVLLFCFAAMFWACGQSKTSEKTIMVIPRHARNFRLADQYLEIWGFAYGKTDTLQLPIPLIPWQRVATLSTTHLPMLKALGLSDRLKAMTYASLVYDSAIRTAIAQGKIADLGSEPQPERLAALGIEAIFVFGMDAATIRVYRQMEALDIAVVPIGEWMEASPLGRAEWIKVFGYLFGRQAQAHAVFDSIEAQYLAIKLQAPAIRPIVISGAGFNGQWNAPGGKSYMAQLIADAGGEYVLKNDTSAGSLTMGTEGFYQAASRAQIWLNPGIARSKADILAMEPRAVFFAPMQKGRIFNCSKRVSSAGGYDFYESGVLRPDLILRDLTIIFSGDSTGLYFYEPLH